jgi:hypothetical protein
MRLAHVRGAHREQQQLVVHQLTSLPDGRPSPAQLAQVVREGDVLVAVNGVALQSLPLHGKLSMLLELGRQPAEVVMGFRRDAWARYGEGEDESDGEGLEEAEEEGKEQEGRGGPPVEEVSPLLSLLEEMGADPLAASAALGEDGERLMSAITDLGGLGSVLSPWAAQKAVQHLLTSSRIFPWGAPPPQATAPVSRAQQAERKCWGTFQKGDLSLGLRMTPEELQEDLDSIASDVRAVLVTALAAEISR